MAGRVMAASPHRHKFTIAYFVLAAIVGMAVAVFVVLRSSSGTTTLAPGGAAASSSTPAAWHGFRPEGYVSQQVDQIGAYIGATYRLPNGRALVAIKASAPASVQNSLLITDYALSTTTSGQTSYDVVPATNAVSYQMCGLGPNCSIAEGRSTPARGRLVRREALELALYTFHYEPAVESVVTYLPPRQGERPTYALLFQRSQLQARLLRPLAATLPEARPPQADAIPPQEAATIDGLTAPDLYRFSFTRGQDGGIWLVFNPPSLG